MIKTFCWTLFLVLFGFICALFLTEDLTRVCSDNLLACLTQKSTLPLWDKMSGGFICVMQNIWCVLTRLFI